MLLLGPAERTPVVMPVHLCFTSLHNNACVLSWNQTSSQRAKTQKTYHQSHEHDLLRVYSEVFHAALKSQTAMRHTRSARTVMHLTSHRYKVLHGTFAARVFMHHSRHVCDKGFYVPLESQVYCCMCAVRVLMYISSHVCEQGF